MSPYRHEPGMESAPFRVLSSPPMLNVHRLSYLLDTTVPADGAVADEVSRAQPERRPRMIRHPSTATSLNTHSRKTSWSKTGCVEGYLSTLRCRSSAHSSTPNFKVRNPSQHKRTRYSLLDWTSCNLRLARYSSMEALGREAIRREAAD
jgi:hypothetical protein